MRPGIYAGGALELFQLDERQPEEMQRIVIGNELHAGQHLQWTVPAGVWFGSRPLGKESGGYALLGCTVSPGFDFADFEMAERAELVARFPLFSQLIEQLTAGPERG